MVADVKDRLPFEGARRNEVGSFRIAIGRSEELLDLPGILFRAIRGDAARVVPTAPKR